MKKAIRLRLDDNGEVYEEEIDSDGYITAPAVWTAPYTPLAQWPAYIGHECEYGTITDLTGRVVLAWCIHCFKHG